MGCKNSKQTNAVIVNTGAAKQDEIEVTLQDYQQRELLLPDHARSDCKTCCVCSRARVGVNDLPPEEGIALDLTSSNTSLKSSISKRRKRSQYAKLSNDSSSSSTDTRVVDDIVMPKTDGGIEVVKSFDLEYGAEAYFESPARRKNKWYEEAFGTCNSNESVDNFAARPSLRRKHSWPKDGRHYVERTNRKRPRRMTNEQERRAKRCKTMAGLPFRNNSVPKPSQFRPFANMEVIIKKTTCPPDTVTTTSITEDPSHWSSSDSTIADLEETEKAREATDPKATTENNFFQNGECAEACEDVPLREDPDYEKYIKMLKMGIPEGAVRNALQRDGKDPGIINLDPDKSLKSQTDKGNSEAEQGCEEGNDGPPLKDDPEYAKYFKMLKMGFPEGAVWNSLQRDGKDPSIMDLDHDKSLKSQMEDSNETDEGNDNVDDGPPLKEDPEYEKYFKMLKMGLPDGAVRNALQRDRKHPGIIDLDPDKSLKSQATKGDSESEQGRDDEANDDPPLKDDPEYEKYFRMLKLGLPEGAARNALQRDGKDPGIMDLDPDKSLKAQTGRKGDADSDEGNDHADDGPPLKDDPEYEKYFKMLKMGLPEGAVRNALQRDGKDPSIMELDFNKSLNSQTDQRDAEPDEGNGHADVGLPLKDDPEYEKYFKMLKMGLPEGAVRNALQRDGKHPGIIDLDPDKSLNSQIDQQDAEPDEGDDRAGDVPPLKENPEYEKYFKMLKMGLPEGAVRNALARDGKDPGVMELDPDKSLKSQTGAKDEIDDYPVLENDPEFSKYYKMLKMMLPMGAVKQAMQRDGKDPGIIDLDPSKSLKSQLSCEKHKSDLRKIKGKKAESDKAAKKRVRRKKVYWTPIDPGKINKESIWSLCKGSVDMNSLNYDPKEFEQLFTESTDPNDKRKNGGSGKKKASKQKKSIQVIDGKRGMNGGIILARLKMEYSHLAEKVDQMDSGNLDSTQLGALKEFLPTNEERKALFDFMNANGASRDAADIGLAGLSECEKYMVAMLKVSKPEAKFDCMLFRSQLRYRLDDLKVAIKKVRKACDEVRTSEKLTKMMAMILTVVNHINTGGHGKLAAGFSLDALLKLNEAKAFDKKTSVLEYLAKLVKRNNESLLVFKDDIESVSAAGSVQLDTLVSGLNALRVELDEVQKNVKEHADHREQENGGMQSTTEAEKDSVDSPHSFSHGDATTMRRINGRTSMEEFVFRATDDIKETETELDELKKKYAKLLQYFGEDEKMPSNEFFGTMHKFALAFGLAVNEVERKEKVQLKEKLRFAARKVGAAKRLASKAWTKTSASAIDRTAAQGMPAGTDPRSSIADSQSSSTVDELCARNNIVEEDIGENAGADDHLTSGIPALADGCIAAEAAAHHKKREDPSKDIQGNLAAVAAAAAQNRCIGVRGGSSNLGGVIASTGAAAALTRLQEKEGDEGKNATEVTVPSAVESLNHSGAEETSKIQVLGDEGVAQAAAAVFRTRYKKKENTHMENLVRPTTRVAEAPAAAAQQCDTRSSVDGRGDPHKSASVGGIAAAVAAAALARSSLTKRSSKDNEAQVARGIFGGAVFKVEDNLGGEDFSKSGGSAISCNGIADGAAAAAAPLRFKEKQNFSNRDQRPEQDIGAGADPAAAVHSLDDDDKSAMVGRLNAAFEAHVRKGEEACEDDDLDSTAGIVGDGALAGRKRPSQFSEDPTPESLEDCFGGIAVAAAAAAKARSREKNAAVESSVAQ